MDGEAQATSYLINLKGGFDMTAISEFIVYLWLAPVTLFVILPLALFLIVSPAKTLFSLLGLSTNRGAESWESAPVES